MRKVSIPFFQWILSLVQAAGCHSYWVITARDKRFIRYWCRDSSTVWELLWEYETEYCQGSYLLSHWHSDTGFTCRIDMFDKNRPSVISPERLRYEFSVFEDDLLNTWKCEYRYTRQEVETMKAGRFRDIHVSLGHATKVMKMHLLWIFSIVMINRRNSKSQFLSPYGG